MISIIESEGLDISSPFIEYCISWCSIWVANVGLKMLVQSWNNHPVPSIYIWSLFCCGTCIFIAHLGISNSIRRGSPNYRMTIDNRVKKIPANLIPSTSEAKYAHRCAGGIITEEHQFGIVPLNGYPEKRRTKNEAFLQQFSFDNIFHSLVNGNDNLFKEALLFFVTSPIVSLLLNAFL